MKTSPSPKTIAAALSSLDPNAKLCDLPDDVSHFGGPISDALRIAGYEESPRVVIGQMNAWNLTVAEFAASITPSSDT